MKKNPLVVVCGPTSSGKTSLALRLCHEFGGEIISADSRQVYRHMDVGTGKLPVTKSEIEIKKGNGMWEVGGIPVWLYDVVAPNQNFTVVEYGRRAVAEIEGCWRRGKIPFLVGGTGFYIDVVLGKSAVAGVPPDFELRRELEKLSTGELFEKLRVLDFQRAETIDPQNPRRLIRAIEVAVASSEGVTRRAVNCASTGYVHHFGLAAPRQVLYARADRWAEAIVSSGSLIDEVYDLLDRGYRETPVMRGIVYRTALGFVDQKVTRAAMLERIQFDLHGYIRRQLTWFKRDKTIHWVDISEPGFDKRVADALRSKL